MALNRIRCCNVKLHVHDSAMDYAAKLMANVKVCVSGCWEWQRYRLPTGYGRTHYHGENMLAHRLAWIVLRGEIPANRCVCHRCDNPPCCNPEHLFVGTHKANMRDALKKGRLKIGNLVGVTRFRRVRKLTNAQVEEILTSNESSRALADRFGCTYTNVYMIRNGLRKIAPMRNTLVLEVEF